MTRLWRWCAVEPSFQGVHAVSLGYYRHVMFNVDKYLRRRVTIRHLHGRSSIRIERQNSRGRYFWTLCFTTAAFLLFCDTIFDTSRRRPNYIPYILPVFALGLMCYVIAIGMAVWGAFGVEEIVVEAGTLRWTRTAWKWKRTRIILFTDITAIKAITPWYGLDNTIEITAGGKQRRLGDKLLRDEAIEVAKHLRRAVGLTEFVSH